MDMMKCPHCGVANSTKRELCYQCERGLRDLPKAQQQGPTVICGTCSLAALSPPPGTKVTHDEVWCTHRQAAIHARTSAGACFQQAFGWGREQILD